MVFVSNQLSIKLRTYLGEPCLYFTFRGKFTKDVSQLASESWGKQFEDNPEKSCAFIWDCMEMTGFEIAARTVWYEMMSKHKSRISKVIVISDNIMIRGAARVMMNLFGVSSTIFKSREAYENIASNVEG